MKKAQQICSLKVMNIFLLAEVERIHSRLGKLEERFDDIDAFDLPERMVDIEVQVFDPTQSVDEPDRESSGE